MPTYRILTKAGQKGPFTLRVILRGLETGKIPKTATLEEVETGRQIKAAELLGETSRESNSQRQSGSSDIPLEASAPLELLESDLDPLPSFRPMQQPPGSVQAIHGFGSPSAHDDGSMRQLAPHRHLHSSPAVAIAGASVALFCWPIGLVLSIFGLLDAQKRKRGVGVAYSGIALSTLGFLLMCAVLAAVSGTKQPESLISGCGTRQTGPDAPDNHPQRNMLPSPCSGDSDASRIQESGPLPIAMEDGELSITEFAKGVNAQMQSLDIRANPPSNPTVAEREAAEAVAAEARKAARRRVKHIHAYVGVRVITWDESKVGWHKPSEKSTLVGWEQSLSPEWNNWYEESKRSDWPWHRNGYLGNDWSLWEKGTSASRLHQPFDPRTGEVLYVPLRREQLGLEIRKTVSRLFSRGQETETFDRRWRPKDTLDISLPREVARTVRNGDALVIRLDWPGPGFNEQSGLLSDEVRVQYRYSGYQPVKVPTLDSEGG